MKPIPLHEFEIDLSVALKPEDLAIARAELNLHFFNDTVCNHIVDGEMVAKYPEIENSNPQIKEAFYNVVRSCKVMVVLELMSDGTFRQQ